MKIVDNYLFFYTNYLSNWHRCDILDPALGFVVPNSEHLFMYYKARFFNDSVSMDQLQNPALHPRESKAIGGKVAGFHDPAWECVAFGYMVFANYLKYSQNEDIKQKLISTGDKILVEASPIDLRWGIGLAENESDKILVDESNWKGKNWLGKALMEVRSKINNLEKV